MKRKIIHINEALCNGCGACADACHEGAIAMVNGKAKLLREDYCDGLGDCLPACPTGAISFEEREALAYNEAAVAKAKAEKKTSPSVCSCPGSAARSFRREERAGGEKLQYRSSQLVQWPCQIKLVPPNAPYFDGADLLIAADCTAYAFASFHEFFMKHRITLIGCPKLDAVDYAEKLTAIFTHNRIKSLTVVRMEVPCCGGLSLAVERACRASGQEIAIKVITISTDGKIVRED